MSEVPVRPIVKWPFLAGDLLLVALSFYIVRSAQASGGSIPHLTLGAASLLSGCILAIIPFILEYRLMGRISESASLQKVVAQLKQLETFAEQVGSATANWQTVQEHCNKTVGAAGEITKKMAAEVQAFGQFIQRVNDTEKGHMRLELEKLKRAEGDWIQVLVRMMDHVYALHQGGMRSGQQPLIEQLTHFQNACKEAARRVGLSPFVAEGETFDPAKHQLMEGDKGLPAGSRVTQTIATGYTLQGRLLRPALVRVQPGGEQGALAPSNQAPAATERDENETAQGVNSKPDSAANTSEPEGHQKADGAAQEQLGF